MAFAAKWIETKREIETNEMTVWNTCTGTHWEKENRITFLCGVDEIALQEIENALDFVFLFFIFDVAFFSLRDH